MIERNPELLIMSSFVDVFDASVDVPKKTNDHLHLVDEWYRELGTWFSRLITGQTAM